MPELNHKDTSLSPTVAPKLYKNGRKTYKYWLVKYRRILFISLKNLKGKPAFLARGAAVGVFAGCFPLLGLQSLIGVLLAVVFRGSKVAAVAFTWVSNPLTYIPLFLFNFKVGKFLLGIDSISSQDIDFESWASFLELGSTVAVALVFGSFIIGAIASVIAYFASFAFFKRLQYKKLRRRIKRG